MSHCQLFKVGLVVIFCLGFQNQGAAEDVTYPLSESGVVGAPISKPESAGIEDVAVTPTNGSLTTCTMKYKLSGFSLGFNIMTAQVRFNAAMVSALKSRYRQKVLVLLLVNLKLKVRGFFLKSEI